MKINIKKIIIILLLFIPVISFAQQTEKQKETKQEDVVITINVTKINKTIGKVIGFIRNEKKQFKQEIIDNLTPEELQGYKEAKENLDYELKYIHDAIHAGWSQGWRGESYSPPYKHK